ncbi:alpha/beta fold hydrolase [Mitsuaria sp. WAJ17]|uniref:GMC family oxidoreductase N-terminal domain-containing protein n=1 Tax=Mitsuaria sp. WAJ17 TaxID=2761452 RepID=UPI0016015FCE|nr:GMC family oxidoreductase N-terminal domain-containing protein [Mitsuaria sp. WAJ17]MBB2487087.1 alpha/beta fold hydrolase [Mitsuaria sp. WAJ17]
MYEEPRHEDRRRHHWLSRPLSDWLLAHPRDGGGALDADVIVVGSGYGAAAAVEHLSRCTDARGAPLRILLLERGLEYLPGRFPARMAELPGHVRFSMADEGRRGQVKGYREALFDFRLGPDLAVVLANGLGGGSLINAGVMLEAEESVFRGPRWPARLRSDPASMNPWYAKAAQLLGAEAAAPQGERGEPNTIAGLSTHAPRRADYLRSLAMPGLPAREVPITVALRADPRSAAGLPLDRCVACGDCATGCNHGAKESLDTNLLWLARRRGVQMLTGATVLHVLPLGPDAPDGEAAGWQVAVLPTDENQARQEAEPFLLRARRVVLAAGSLGSTEILLRSRHRGLALSDRLGEGVSANGDLLAAIRDTPPLNALADEAQDPAARQAGPTITAMLDARQLRDPDPERPLPRSGQEPLLGCVLQDLAIPGPMRWAFEQIFALGETLDGLSRPDRSEHGAGFDFPDPYAITRAASARTLPVALIGMDAAQGRMSLQNGAEGEEGDPGSLQIRWPELGSDPQVLSRHRWLRQHLAAQGQRLLANPLWEILPEAMGFLIEDRKGPLLTVHPLGGCAMADRIEDGVVNEWGQVLRPTLVSGEALNPADRVHPDLAVLDGAIVPGALGINPALSISALVLRALPELCQRWGLQPGAETASQDPAWLRRPLYRDRRGPPPPEQPTLLELREQLVGLVRVPGAQGGETKQLELSFEFEPTTVQRLVEPGPDRVLHGTPACRLRLFDTRRDPQRPLQRMAVSAQGPDAGHKLWKHAEHPDAAARWIAPLEQVSLRVFHRAPSSYRQRLWRGLWAWWLNRGWRDAAQALQDLLAQGAAPRARPISAWTSLRERWANALALASHGGQERLMRYELRIPAALPDAPDWARPLLGQTLLLHKRIRYSRRANPWKQLTRATLEQGPFRSPDGSGPPVLELDLDELARQRQPLLRLVQAEDLSSALRDVGSLLAYTSRLVMGVHAWTFRKPDAAPPREIHRLPGAVPGLPLPEIQEIAVGRCEEAGLSRGTARHALEARGPVMIRLTRYRREGGRPLLMIHGYSASGTTFAHHSVQPGPARLMHEAGWDVWILDMRTSAGMPTARLPWTFEECALNDIPVAMDAVRRATGAVPMDVLAHCMGSVMLHMALLQPQRQPEEHFFPLRRALMDEGWIRRLVISQVTPRMVFSPTNAARALLMQHLRPYLPLSDFSFRPERPGLMDELIDRLLASLPYPDEEFDLESPPFPSLRRTPWTRTRHRMDLLYGRDFAIANVAPPVFDFIDDHFGPLNMDTVAQAIHFSRSRELTDWRGASLYLDDLRKAFAQLAKFPVLSLHGELNGLCEPESGELLHDLYAQGAPGRHEFRVIAGHGHQDCLIGHDIEHTVFRHVIEFLRREMP